MHPIFKIAAVAAPTLLMLACGGGGGGGSAPSSAGGGVSKGIIIGGEINIFAIDAGQVSDTPLTEASITDENGQYSITIPSGHSSPILLRLSMVQDDANDVTTTMKCDLPAGCGTGIDFGKLYTPSAGFTMEAILASGSGQISAAITPLTDIGAKLALSRLESGNSNGAAATVIDFANSQVTNRFGLMTSVTAQKIVDITDVNAANTASKEELRNSALAAAVVAAVQNEQGGTIEAALETFVTRFVANGIADKDSTPDDNTTTTLTEVLAQAKAVLAKAGEAINGASSEDDRSANFSSAQTEVENDQAAADADGSSTVADQGSGSEFAGADELTKTKAFVQQLRDLALNLEDGLAEGTAAAEQIDMIATLNQDDVDATLESTGEAVTAIVDAYTAYDDAEDDAKPSSHTSDDGIVVDISVTGEKRTFTIDHESEETEINLVAVVDFSQSEDEGDDIYGTQEQDCFGNSFERQACTSDGERTSQSDFSATLRELSIAGDVVFGNASLSILDTTDVNGGVSYSGNETLTYEQTVGDDNGDYTYSEDYGETYSDSGTLTFNFGVQLTVKADQDSAKTAPENSPPQASEVIFTGGLTASLTSFKLDSVETENYDDSRSGDTFSNSYANTEFSTLEFGLAALGLSGSIEDDLGNRAAATITINVDGNGAVLEESSGYSNTSDNSGFEFDESGEGFEESEDNFVKGSIAVTLVADINGISDHTKIEFSAARTEFDTATLSLRVEYGVPGDDDARLAQHIAIQGTATDLDGEPDEKSDLTITNQDGVEASLNNADDELNGTIVFNGTTYATITPETIRYIDGTIESF
jgi:hypothetical protein